MSKTDLTETVARALASAKGIEICADASYRHSTFGPLATAALTAIREAGYAVVPIEPTEAMLQGACEKHRPGQPMSATTPHWRGPEWDTDEECPSFVRRRKIYRAMINAADSGEG